MVLRFWDLSDSDPIPQMVPRGSEGDLGKLSFYH